MRYKPDHRKESHARILEAVGEGFRSHGYGGIGVDGLAKAAGLTSGAFYGHFPSKSAAFHEALVEGLRELREGIESFQQQHGKKWIAPFSEFYLGAKRTCDQAQTCTLPTLSPEVERADDTIRADYDAELLAVAKAVANGLPQRSEPARMNKAWAFLALLAGGLTMARAMQDARTAKQIASAVEKAATGLANGV